jgi:AhpD family alkylhydroperoxidase
MKKSELKQRTFGTKTFYYHLKNMMASLNDLFRYKMSGNMDRAFTEKVMLAVTEVNGCRYCNYLHTKLALNAGVSKEDIQILLSGAFENVSPSEGHALIFAQHYADSGGYPDAETYHEFLNFYGDEKAKKIMAIIKAIMVGNIYGLSIDAFISRIKGNTLPDSKFKDEALIIFGIFAFVPTICIHILFQRVFKRPAVCLKTIKNSLSKLTSCV